MYIKSSLAGAEFSNLYGFSCFPQLYSDLNTTNNNLSNKADKTSLSSYALKSDFPNYFKFLRIDADPSSYDTEVLEHISSLNNTGFIIYCEHSSVSMYMGFIVGNGNMEQYYVLNMTRYTSMDVLIQHGLDGLN